MLKLYLFPKLSPSIRATAVLNIAFSSKVIIDFIFGEVILKAQNILFFI